jgi:hypothetical protein
MTLFKRKIACLFAIACMISVAGSSSVRAQSNPFGGLLGGFIGAATTFTARQEWKSLDPQLMACMKRSARPGPAELAKQGIGPGDAKIAGKINACYGDAGPPRLGVRLKKVSQQRADAISDILSTESSGDDTPESTPESLAGALSSVARVDPRGVGGKAGLLAGDVIYKFNGIQVSGDNLAGMVRIAKPAKNYELEVFRDDKMRRVSIKFPSAEVRLAANAEFVRERAARRKAEAENQRKAQAIAAKRQREEAERRKAAADRKAKAKSKKLAKLRQEIFEGEEYSGPLNTLFNGHPRDLVYLLNLDSKGLTRGLSGDYVIASETASVCSIPPTEFQHKKNEFHAVADKQLAQKIKKSVRLKNCGSLSQEKSPVIFLERGIKNTIQPAKLKWVLEKIRDKKYLPYHVAEYTPFETQKLMAKKAEEDKKRQLEARRQKIEEGILAGSLDGFSQIYVSKKKTVCMESDSNQTSVRSILQASNYASQNIKSDGLEALFLKLKTKECGTFYGKTASLKILSEALRRDGVKVIFSAKFVKSGSFVQLAAEADERNRLAEEAKSNRLALQRLSDAKNHHKSVLTCSVLKALSAFALSNKFPPAETSALRTLLANINLRQRRAAWERTAAFSEGRNYCQKKNRDQCPNWTKNDENEFFKKFKIAENWSGLMGTATTTKYAKLTDQFARKCEGWFGLQSPPKSTLPLYKRKKNITAKKNQQRSVQRQSARKGQLVLFCPPGQTGSGFYDVAASFLWNGDNPNDPYSGFGMTIKKIGCSSVWNRNRFMDIGSATSQRQINGGPFNGKTLYKVEDMRGNWGVIAD